MNRKFKFLYLIFSIGLSLCAASISVAFDQFQIQSWTTDNGLPQNTVRQILQTPDGYLWMTTLDGLARFDGVRFKIFNKQNSPGLASNRLYQIAQTADGDLWISAETQFVVRYHNGEFTSFDLGGKPNNIMRSLQIDDRGAPLVFSNDGMFRWNGTDFAPAQPIAGENNRSVILWSRSGAFWYGDGNLLRRLLNGKISEFQLSNSTLPIEIVNLFEDSRGRIWIGTHNGLFIFENEQLKLLTTDDGLPNNDARSFFEDRNGNVWILTVEGVVMIAPDGKIGVLTTAEGLSDNSGMSIFQDREGSIWIGTLRHGLNRLTTRSISFYSTKNGLAAPIVNPIYQLANDDIILGGGGVTLFHNNKFEPFPLPPLDNAESIPRSATAFTQDRAGRIWGGYWNGAYTYENGKFTDFTKKIFSGLTPSVYDIHEASDGTLWFATNAGIFRYQNDAVTHFTKAQSDLATDDVKVIHESVDGTFWFGTQNGLSQFKNGGFTNYTTADGLVSSQVRSLYEDADKVLWIGSYDGGLTRFKAGKFTRYTTNDGLFNDGVFQILEDGRGNLWMSCNRGIYRVAKQQLDDFADGRISRIESIVYDKSDGLLETECNGGQQPAGAKMRDGKLWFPTQGGVAVIDPETIQKNPVAPPVVIETAKVDGADVALTDEIEIAPGKNNLEVSYTGLSFIKPEFVKFRYQLKGQDETWIEAGNRRTAYYSYLPPGEYVFTVIAANADGVWNETGASIKVKVTPVFYRTWWFLILVIILSVAVIFAFYRQRMNRLEQAHRLQENFSRQLIESQETERQRIAAELHDGLGQSLLVIKNRALLGKMSIESKTESDEQFEEISSASSKAIEEVREIAYNLRPYHLDRLGLTQSIKAMLEPLAEVTGIDFAYDVMPLEGVFSKTEEVLVYRIVQESVNNIIKHSGASEASVLIYRANEGLTLTIEDNGRGFIPKSRNQTRGGFGLIGIEERVRILGGILQIRSEPDNGTTIIVRELGNK